MPQELNHGPRLSDEEYEAKIIALHRDLPPMPSAEQDRQTRRMALDLAIDHRLGCAFPAERRERLWAIQERVEKRRLWLALRHPLRRFFAKRFARGAQGLAGYLVEEYANVLSRAELERFFGLADGQRPGLPFDTEQISRPRSGG
ncbi:MAG: hypothetical protein MUD16_05775 [Desulfobacterales bacterium]|jgi:hypothetical protein|nr:hypothetical protein [Desulfobacterales bacterium]